MTEGWRISHRWEKPAIALTQPSDNNLRISLAAPAGSGGHGMRVAVALDTSRSMVQEMRLEEAREACVQLAGMIGGRDFMHLATYSTKLRELVKGLAGGERLVSEVRSRLLDAEPRGLTRTQLALDWMAAELAMDELRACIGILITDGVPTDERGYPLAGHGLLEDRVRRMRDEGSRLYTIGIGESDYFDPLLLDSLAQLGGGRFVYQPHPGGLSAAIRQLMDDCRRLGTKRSSLRIQGRLQGMQIRAISRVSHDLQHIEMQGAEGMQLASLGVLNEDSQTELLLELGFAASPFGSREGERLALSLELLQDDTVVARHDVNVSLSNSFTQTRQVNEDVSRDASRLKLNGLLRNLQQEGESRQTSRLLEQVIDSATKLERPEIAEDAREQLSELKKTGKLTRHRATSLLSRAARDERHDK